MGRLDGKVAIVTGAGSGIGRAIALGFVREGAKVAALDRNGQAAEETARQAESEMLLALAADHTVEAQVHRAVEQTIERFGRLDVLVNNAAIQLVGRDARVADLDEAAWDETMAVNLKGPFLCCKHAVPAMVRAGGGSVINLGSPTAFRGIGSGYTAYACSKGAIHTLTRLVAWDYAKDGVRCNAIVPGPTQTNLTANIFNNDEYREATLKVTPIGRLGQPEDLVGVAIFLASDESRYATGALFFVDGGMTMA